MDHKRNNSKKRQAILDMLRGTTAHPSAETIYSTLKPQIPELSIGTVYRNLQILEQEQLVRTVCIVDDQARYDACMEPHVHCICRKCRRVLDAGSVEPDRLAATLLFEHGFIPEYFDITVTGLCGQCS